MRKGRARKLHPGYSGLSRRITREYERKGYGPKRASQIGHATAGKVANIKHRKAHHR